MEEEGGVVRAVQGISSSRMSFLILIIVLVFNGCDAVQNDHVSKAFN